MHVIPYEQLIQSKWEYLIPAKYKKAAEDAYYGRKGQTPSTPAQDSSKENKEILQRVEKQCNIIKTEMEALIYKLYRVNAVYEKVEQKNKKLIQKIQNIIFYFSSHSTPSFIFSYILCHIFVRLYKVIFAFLSVYTRLFLYFLSVYTRFVHYF